MESSDLGEADNLDDVADIDVVRAMGMAGAKNPLGAALWRLKYAQDGSVAQITVELLEKELRRSKYAPIVNWQDARKVVMQVLDHYLDCNCKVCGGRGHLTIDGNVQVLQEADCPHCGGTGERALPDMPGRNEAAKWVRGLILQKEFETDAQVMRRLGRRSYE